MSKRRVVSKRVQHWRVTYIGGSRATEICELQADSAEAAI
jgi:hypothetical protein